MQVNPVGDPSRLEDASAHRAVEYLAEQARSVRGHTYKPRHAIRIEF
jgi:hypothetical protein